MDSVDLGSAPGFAGGAGNEGDGSSDAATVKDVDPLPSANLVTAVERDELSRQVAGIASGWPISPGEVASAISEGKGEELQERESNKAHTTVSLENDKNAAGEGLMDDAILVQTGGDAASDSAGNRKRNRHTNGSTERKQKQDNEEKNCAITDQFSDLGDLATGYQEAVRARLLLVWCFRAEVLLLKCAVVLACILMFSRVRRIPRSEVKHRVTSARLLQCWSKIFMVAQVTVRIHLWQRRTLEIRRQSRLR